MPKEVEDCVNALMNDSDFKPSDPSQSKEQAAWAVCQSAHGNKSLARALNKIQNREVVKFWMPITKKEDGTYSAILSDTSLDRDTEMMGETLIDKIARQGIIPQLADHKNEMESWTGAWKNLRKIKGNQHVALMADPIFFTENANPKAGQIKKQVDEALDMGLNPGVSIGLIPFNHETKIMDDREVVVYTDGELVEASWTPVQSNRNATYGHVAKKFKIGGFDMKEKNTSKQEGGSGLEDRLTALEQRISALEELATSKNEETEEQEEEQDEDKEEKNEEYDYDANTDEGNTDEDTQDEDVSDQAKPEKKVRTMLARLKAKHKRNDLEKAVKKVLDEKLKGYKPQRKGHVPAEAIAKALGVEIQKENKEEIFNAAEHYLTKVKGMQLEKQ